MQINCDNCDVSKYGGYFAGVQEFCLKHDRSLKRDQTENRVIPCMECGGRDFVPDTWDE